MIRIKKRYLLVVTVAIIILLCLLAIEAVNKKSKAAEITIPAKETLTCTVDGVERTIILSANIDNIKLLAKS